MRSHGILKFGIDIGTILLALLCTRGMAGNFDLRVNDVSGLEEPWPLVGGLPFAEGELSDASQVRILGADGAEVPAQIDVAATYRDGSIRWALAAFTASPQGAYRVEFGPGVSRDAPARPLRIERGADGSLTVDTGSAVYEFLPDRLLPESARMGDTAVLVASGDGAYLVDNHGRLSRVAGERAEVASKILTGGPARAVIRREGWYVTSEGERVARARAWFYLAAGSPYLRVTHSLVFTEDTNDLWLRDYGLEFRTPDAPQTVTFALEKEDGESLVQTQPAGGEVYLFQDTFPHFLDRQSRAVVGRQAAGKVVTPAARTPGKGSFRQDEWLTEAEVAGDWGEAVYAGHALTVVMPHLAQRFPKDIAFGPDGARVAFWSGRAGRELDFRAATLVEQYWGEWAELAPGGAAKLAAYPSNAQGASRTHDVWLLPRPIPAAAPQARAAARAATDPPLLQPAPAWICSSGALGWMLHPKDEERFPEQESLIVAYWDRLMAQREARAPYGFIEWGRHPAIRGMGSFFRLSRLVDYGLRRHVWGLYARSGERGYYDYATAFNRFAGDWEMADWDTDGKFRGGLAAGTDIHLPFYWGTQTTLIGYNITGDDIGNWALEYYMTGDAWAADRLDLTAEAFRSHFDPADIPHLTRRVDSVYAFIRRMVVLSTWTRDETFLNWARAWVDHLVDFDNPKAITDEIRLGPLYKTDRNLLFLYEYYRLTGDETARRAVLQALDYKYRFSRIGLSFTGQAYPAMLYAIAYRWTGNPDYLRVANYVVESGLGRSATEPGGVHINFHQTHALPAALAVLAEVDGPIDPWPVVTLFREPVSARLLFRKADDGQAVEFRCTVWMEEDFTEPEARLAAWGDGKPGPRVAGLRLEPELAFQPSSGHRADPRHWSVRVIVPGDVSAGLYQLDFPGAVRVDVLNSSAAETAVYAPDGFRTRGDAIADYFSVPPGQEELRLILGIPFEVRCPDGSVVIEAARENIGEQVIPVEGRAGAWSVMGTQSGIVRLLNTEPLFSRSRRWLVTGARVEPAAQFKPPSTEVAFVPGRGDRQALHLPGDARLRFPRGEETAGGYEHFPGGEGTVEFWFRPNWSSAELPYTMGSRFNDRYFLRAGSHDLQYRRGQVRPGEPEFASLNLWAHGRQSNAGFTGRFWFQAGEWYHLAFTWRTLEGSPGDDGHYAVYVNGEPVAPDDFRRGGVLHFWPGRVTGDDPFHRREAEEFISIGPLDGTIAQWRVSDTVRYPAAFDPSDTLPEPDARTRVQFPLDGDRRGETAGSAAISLEP